MNDLMLSGIYIYPVKSLGGISLGESILEERGLQYDRRWVLVDDEGIFITQRKYPLLSLLKVSINGDHIMVSHQNEPEQYISFPIAQQNGETIQVTIWDDLTFGIEVSENVSNWFSNYLKFSVRLVKMEEQTKRNVDPKYASENDIVSFADGYPCLIIGQSSLDQLNERLEIPVLMDRFRPNFVFTGGEPHVEDSISDFELGGVLFSAVKPCARCVLITVDQQTGVKGAEPLKTLSKYRTKDHKIMFGQNLIHKGSGTIRIGMKLSIKSTKEKVIA
ncbi:MAG: MOSC domain-containing protein [Pedobacter sp.]|nr:MAG: MOSC domain-containing protein [Pedobacter sp.]